MKSHLQPIESNKKTMTAIVQERIREAILSGELAAGSRIDQVRLAEQLDVSLVPVREALKKLDAEGFVQIVPRRGAFITETSTHDMQELYLARQILEGEAAYHAAEKLSDEEITVLSDLMPQMTQALTQHDYDLFMVLNREFHFTIYQAAQNRYVLNMVVSLWDLSERYRYQYVYLRDQGTVVQAEHQRILEACKVRDKDKLRDAIVHHMQQTMLSIERTSQKQHLSDK